MLSVRCLQSSEVDSPVPLLLTEVLKLCLEFRVPLGIFIFHGKCLLLVILELFLQSRDLTLVLSQFIVLSRPALRL